MNDTIKRYLISSTTTFLATFFGSLALQFQNGGMYFTGAFVLSLLAIAARAGIKAVVEGLIGTHADK